MGRCRCLQGTVLFNIFINNLKEVTESIFLTFAGELVNTLEARPVIQRESDRLEEWANLMKFNMDNCKEVLHLGRNNPMATVQVGDCQAGEKLC